MPQSKPARTVALLLTTLTLVTAATVLALVLHILRTEKKGEEARWKEATQQRLEAGARRVREAWQQREAAVLQLRDLPPSEAFAAVVRDGFADSAIFPDNGQPAYPSLTPPASGASEVPAEVAEALAAQRAKIAAKDWTAAIGIAQEFFTTHRGIKSPAGRDLALGSDLMLLSALRGDRQEVPSWLTQRMTAELKNYRAPIVPSPQRRMLMEELGGAESAAAVFSTYNAECLAQAVLSEDKAMEVEVIAVENSGVRLLFTRAHLYQTVMKINEDPEIGIIPWWVTSERLVETPLHASLPGWRAATSMSDADRRSGVLPVMIAGGAATLLLGGLSILTWRQMQRQIQRAQLQEDLAATVSHELRTPVASMRVLAESLLEEAEPDPKKTREYLQLIAGENVRLSRLIENFLTLARLERRSPSRAEKVSAAEIVDRVTAAAGANALRLQFIGPPPGASLRIEAASLETALLNLLDNACKYSPPDSSVEWSAAVAGRNVVFTVRDHGPGLTRDQIARLWEPFERGDTAKPGCGLGLTIVKRIAEQAGGSVSVETPSGGGCLFRLSLPLAESPPA